MKLTDICDFQGGSQPPKNQWSSEPKEGYIRMLQIRDFTQDNSKVEYVKVTNSIKKCNGKDILIARYGASIGKILTGLSGAYNVAMMKVVIDENIVDRNFIYNFLKSDMFQNYIKNVGQRAAQAGFNKEELSKVNINLPTLEEQKKVAKELDKVQEIIDIREKQIEQLDELIKSQFAEMFGDPFLNDKKWELKELKEISITIADGSNVDKNYYKTKGDVLFLRIQNVWRNEFRLEDSVFISKEENKEYIDTSLKYGDILICKIGRNYTKDTSLGRVAIYLGEDDKANYSNNIMKIRLNDEVNSKFVNVLLNLEDYQDHIKRVSKGGTDKRALNKSIIGDLPIILPPKAMQDEYINKIEQIDKQKFEIQKNLEEIQKLQESLMNKYFG